MAGIRNVRALSPRGQISADFLVAFTVALILFLFVINMYQERSYLTRQASQTIAAENLASKLASCVNGVAMGQEGSACIVPLPSDIGGLNYSLAVRDRLLEVNYGEKSVFEPLYTDRIELGSPEGAAIITKTGGVVRID
ncbi:MAG: hypothetical protein NT157_04810, partial [Candidatus Micrarchaeota archaeon]|nr:hypothetical protein [Candidatus Micrarchaeota archaeon]